MTSLARVAMAAMVLLVLAQQTRGAGATITAGSKQFTESVVLGELAARAADRAGFASDHRRRLGGTPVVFTALRSGEIDVYADYSGTLLFELFADLELPSLDDLAPVLADLGIAMTEPLGFNNSYGIAMMETRAAELGIETISDLRAHPELTLSFGPESVARADVWPGLGRAYDLPYRQPAVYEHELGYRALASGDVDLKDVYTTDAKISQLGLRVLEDDLHHFRRYDAVFLYRSELDDTAPRFVEELRRYQGRIDEDRMIAHNALADVDRLDVREVAARLEAAALGIEAARVESRGRADRILQRTGEHLFLTGWALAIGVALALPLGVIAAKFRVPGYVILGVAGVFYTVPALALLALMIPIPYLGLSRESAIVALVLYSLLPMVRSTQVGIQSIDPRLTESARAMGLSAAARLVRVELPLASRSVIAGIKTAAVITIGFATLGAFIDAGGYGKPILTGLQTLNNTLILEGAIPAAVMALLAHLVFDALERVVLPRGLR